MPPPAEGTGAVHTVMVAPMQGVLRYWPFAVNASVGDTIRYVWSTPANHTATLSSALAPCNRSARAEELKWASGVRNGSAGPQNCEYLHVLLFLAGYSFRTRLQSTSSSQPMNSSSSTAQSPNTVKRACSVWFSLSRAVTTPSASTCRSGSTRYVFCVLLFTRVVRFSSLACIEP